MNPDRLSCLTHAQFCPMMDRMLKPKGVTTMPHYLRRLFRMSLFTVVLTGLLILYISSAMGDMILLATAEDCETAPVSSWSVNEPHAVVLQKTSEKKQKAAADTLKKAGISDVKFLDFPVLKAANRSVKTLEKKWGTDANTAKVASLLRQWKDDCIVYYASGEEDREFLVSFADRCAGGANNPACRKKKKQGDEYLYEVTRLIDGVTNEERAASPADSSWRTAWETKKDTDLSGLPETDNEGFLPEGEKEFVLSDSSKGLWVYLSQALRIVITKNKTSNCSWFEADILRRPEGETLHIVTSLNGLGNKPVKIAEENRLVLGINTDYYMMRVNTKKKTGLIIRKGEVIRESVGKNPANLLPPLDTLLLDANGGFRVDEAGELDSKAAMELGAVDVLSFGPILIRDGRIRMQTIGYHNKKEPRTAVGLLGENHYLMIVAEGRLSNSPGMTLDDLGLLMAARGCTDAINLDGGHTSALIFMGERLNKIGNLSGTGTTGPRNMSELLGIGTHDP